MRNLPVEHLTRLVPTGSSRTRPSLLEAGPRGRIRLQSTPQSPKTHADSYGRNCLKRTRPRSHRRGEVRFAALRFERRQPVHSLSIGARTTWVPRKRSRLEPVDNKLCRFSYYTGLDRPYHTYQVTLPTASWHHTRSQIQLNKTIEPFAANFKSNLRFSLRQKRRHHCYRSYCGKSLEATASAWLSWGCSRGAPCTSVSVGAVAL